MCWRNVTILQRTVVNLRAPACRALTSARAFRQRHRQVDVPRGMRQEPRHSIRTHTSQHHTKNNRIPYISHADQPRVLRRVQHPPQNNSPCTPRNLAIPYSRSLDSNRALVAACAREVSQPDATPAPTIATVHMPHSSPARDGTRHSKRHSKRAPHTGSNTASLISLVCRTGRRCGMRARHPFVWIASAGPIWRHRNRTAASLIHHSRPPRPLILHHSDTRPLYRSAATAAPPLQRRPPHTDSCRVVLCRRRVLRRGRRRVCDVLIR